MPASSGTTNTQPSGRAQYETPRLLRFGDMTELTESVGNMGNPDSPPANNPKTGTN